MQIIPSYCPNGVHNKEVPLYWQYCYPLASGRDIVVGQLVW